MSGRSNYRKTDRKQAPRTPTWERPEIRWVFQLPPTIGFAVAGGVHGYGVIVLPGSLVEVKAHTFNKKHVAFLAAEFLQKIVSRDHPDFTASVVMTSSSEPGWKDYFEIAMVDGSVIVSHTRQSPWIFAARR